jgi:hypothetical protein
MPTARDRRPWIYGVLDVLFAIAYVIIARAARSTDASFEIGSFLLAAGIAAAGVGTAVVRGRVGWWLGVGGCALLLAGATLLITLLILSAAFLAGVFGALGDGAASMSLLVAALVVEVYVLLPAFQLRFLLSADGRRVVRDA